MSDRVGVLFLNFGGPQGPAELEPFLRELLLDVLPGPALLKRLLVPRLARMRAAKMRRPYESIGWSSVVPTHLRQVAAVREALGPDAPRIASGMMFTAPTIRAAVRELSDVDRYVAVPMFPHYSIATTQTAYSLAWQALCEEGLSGKPVHWIPAWFDHPLYLDALAATIRAGVAATPGEGPLHLVFTPHGLPNSFVRRGDPYPDQVRESARRVVELLRWSEPWWIGWQSRVGPAKWLEPSTPDVIRSLAASGASRVCLVPLSFVSEHIETRYEIDVEYKELAHAAGISHFGRAPTLDTEPAFVAMLADLVRSAVASPKLQCVRCLAPETEARRRRASCSACEFETPAFLREARNA